MCERRIRSIFREKGQLCCVLVEHGCLQFPQAWCRVQSASRYRIQTCRCSSFVCLKPLVNKDMLALIRTSASTFTVGDDPLSGEKKHWDTLSKDAFPDVLGLGFERKMLGRVKSRGAKHIRSDSFWLPSPASSSLLCWCKSWTKCMKKGRNIFETLWKLDLHERRYCTNQVLKIHWFCFKSEAHLRDDVYTWFIPGLELFFVSARFQFVSKCHAGLQERLWGLDIWMIHALS